MWIINSVLLVSWLYPCLLYLTRSFDMIKKVNIFCSVLIWGLCWVGLYLALHQSGSTSLTLSSSWLRFTLDTPGIVFALMISTLWLLSLFYSFCYMPVKYSHNSHRNFFICFALAIASTMTLAFGSNLILMLLGYELLTISTIYLIGYNNDTKSHKAMMFYGGTLLGSSLLFLLPALVYIYFFGEYNAVVLTLLILGVAKAATFPLHSWLPRAMVAPVPVSSFLHAIAVVKSGVFVIYRVLKELAPVPHDINLYNYSFLQIWLIFSILYATYYALKSDNLKLRLAFSTMQQLNLMVLMLLSGHYQNVGYVMYYMIQHGFAKLTLFNCSGYINLATKHNCLSQIRGIARSMPVVTAVFVLASASIVGMPLTAGYWAKSGMLHPLQDSGSILPFVGLMCASLGSFLNFAYMLYVMLDNRSPTGTQPAPSVEVDVSTAARLRNCLYVICIGGAMCILLAVVYYPFIDFMHNTSQTVLEQDNDMEIIYAQDNLFTDVGS